MMEFPCIDAFFCSSKWWDVEVDDGDKSSFGETISHPDAAQVIQELDLYDVVLACCI